MANITQNTTIKEAMKNPMAKDMLEKLMLALRLPAETLKKPVVANLKMKALTTFSFGLLDKETVQTICNMFNLEQDAIITDEGVLEPKWWKEAVI